MVVYLVYGRQADRQTKKRKGYLFIFIPVF